jgi:hypothetical protein
LPGAFLETPAQLLVLQILQECGLISISVIARVQRSCVPSIFCQKMSANHPREFKKRSQLFIRVHDEALTVAAMRVCNPDCSPVGINR